ncbi:uncharacterized protein LOC107042816 [Diachasma alloeum]|uniref:uncharacterized protein LOC107042816 n=1 Tax=Diachasma alloeum TaxID=454923 RepID=UPI0007384E64|nr:uncharacterized protein LOC107042816 [Diachasma alloeum]
MVDSVIHSDEPQQLKKRVTPWSSSFELNKRAVLFRLQLNRLKNLENLIGELNTEEIASLTTDDIEAHQCIVETQWTNFSSYHEALIDGVIEDVLNFVEDAFQQALNAYSKAVKKLGRIMAQLRAKERDEISSGTSSSSTLRRIDIPEFSGKYTEWKAFYDIFLSLVHENPKMAEVEKMLRLKGALKGQAEALIKNIGVEAANYSIAWRKFIARYENSRLIMASHLNRILNMEQLKEKSTAGLLAIVNNTTEALEALKSLGAPTEHWDIIVTHIMRRIIDADTRKPWEEKLGDSTQLLELKAFLEFLKARARTLNNVEQEEHNGAPTKPAPKPKPTVKVYQVSSGKSSGKSLTTPSSKSTEPPSAKRNCIACGGPHWIGAECPKFIFWRPHERKQFMESNALCYNCMGPHRAHKCKSDRRCKTCQGLHHTFIHNAPVTAGQSTVDSSGASTSSNPNRSG